MKVTTGKAPGEVLADSMKPHRKVPLFRPGQIRATPGTMDVLQMADKHPFSLIRRHLTGDWGDLSEEDKAENEFSVDKRLRIFSAYELESGAKIWVITEADRSSTTLLLPSEY